MSDTFLHKIIKHLSASHPGDWSEVCIVLPNRRAGLFFKKYLSLTLEKPVWSPNIYSIEDFVVMLSDIELLDNTALIFELYNVYKKQQGEKAESLDEFFKWASHLITDFNEIDSYLVDGKNLFSNLSEIKELENWSLHKPELTDFQTKYLHFWKSLGVLYEEFRHKLLEKKRGYQGLIYRQAVEAVMQKTDKLVWKKILFAGFNALNMCEEKLINQLILQGKTEIIWDTDLYYMENKQQEAGKFLRKYKEKIFPATSKKSIFIEENLLSTDKKNITIIGSARNVLQAKVAGNILAELVKEDPDLTNTAIVLADENLLFPVLHSLPENVKEINVTMGYPLKYSPIAELSELLFNLHESAERLGRKNSTFYYKDIIKLIKHPYIASFLVKHDLLDFAKRLERIIIQRNIPFLTFREIEKISENPKLCSLLEVFLNPWETSGDILDCLEKTVEMVAGTFSSMDDENSVETRSTLTMEFLSIFLNIIKRVRSLHEEYKMVFNTKTLHTILTQLIRLTRIPFYGEPLNGLQIMGMLETRALDFKNIILLSANENILPAGKNTNSFIPYDIRSVFGLPTYADKDAIFAYHFYRLIQRPSTIFLLYNTETDLMGSGEQSRFITQVVHELPEINPLAKVREMILDSSATLEGSQDLIIEKNEEILKLLVNKAQSGFSPSLLNIYRSCSLQFYFHAIAGIREPEEVEETIGADTLGTIIHDSLHILYQPYISKIVGAEDIQQMISKTDDVIKVCLEKQHFDADTLEGKNLLIITIARKFILNLLHKETSFIKQAATRGQHLIIRDLEKELSGEIDIKNLKVKIKGKADRIDLIGDTIRIIDYKTGKAENKELQINEWTDLIDNKDLSKSFQLLMYALLYSTSVKENTYNILSGIITFRELSVGLKTVKVQGKEILSEGILMDFKNELTSLLENIFNPSLPFMQTADQEICEYCSFKVICNR